MRPITRRGLLTVLASVPAADGMSVSAQATTHRILGEADVINRTIDVVAGYFAVPVEKMVAPIRWRDVVLPKQKAIYLAYELSGRTLLDVGSYFGRDHEASVWYPMLRVYLMGVEDCAQAAEVRGLAHIIDTRQAQQVDWDARPRVRR